jgi:hypothetical protein
MPLFEKLPSFQGYKNKVSQCDRVQSINFVMVRGNCIKNCLTNTGKSLLGVTHLIRNALHPNPSRSHVTRYGLNVLPLTRIFLYSSNNF